MSRTARIILIFAFSSFAIGLAAPFAYAASSCALSPIYLEVGIGASRTSTGLTDYIAQVYQFIVSSIGVVAAVMIMFNGMRWVTAGGNSENITVAKGGIISAIVGLLIALMSYVLLYAVNGQLVDLVDICPTGLDFSTGGVATTWNTCPGESVSECASVSYCLFEGGCECANVGAGDGKLFVCRPLAIGEITAGGKCQNDENCVSPLKCVGNSLTDAGVCAEEESGKQCDTSADCTDGLACTEAGPYKVCLEPTGRANGTYCEQDVECGSGVCNTSTGVDYCVAGDATTTESCRSDSDCANGYECGGTSLCVAKVEGSNCEQYDSECGAGLYCVDTGSYGTSYSGECTDGSLADLCDDNSECDSGFCALYFCRSGETGQQCDDGEDCKSGVCDTSYANECT